MNGRTGLRRAFVYSSFLVTINLNKVKPRGNRGRRWANVFEAALRELLGRRENLRGLIKFLPNDDDGVLAVGLDVRPPYIHSIKSWFGLQEGTKLGRYHAHVLVTIKHKSKIHIDADFVRLYFKTFDHNLPDDIFRRNEPGKNVYVNVKFVKGRGAVVRYILDGMSVISDNNGRTEPISSEALATLDIRNPNRPDEEVNADI